MQNALPSLCKIGKPDFSSTLNPALLATTQGPVIKGPSLVCFCFSMAHCFPLLCVPWQMYNTKQNKTKHGLPCKHIAPQHT